MLSFYPLPILIAIFFLIRNWKEKKHWKFLIPTIVISIFLVNSNTNNNSIQTSGSLELSNSKIEWGIKRADNNKQPDLGKRNKELIDKYNGMAMGSMQNKSIYLTFDLGYEAGYTNKILDILKEKIDTSYVQSMQKTFSGLNTDSYIDFSCFTEVGGHLHRFGKLCN